MSSVQKYKQVVCGRADFCWETPGCKSVKPFENNIHPLNEACKYFQTVISLFQGVRLSAEVFLSHILYCLAVFSFPVGTAGRLDGNSHFSFALFHKDFH